MTVDRSPHSAPAPQVEHGSAGAHAHPGAHAHGHAHGHLHAHSHTHAHAHGPTHAHDHGAHPVAPSPVGEPRSSLLMSSAPGRLAGAVGLIAVLWAAVAWALSGTP